MHVFLSPHLDDAVYSCGGTIHKLTTGGEQVRIITVMGGDPPSPPPDTPITRDLHARWRAGHTPTHARRLEDKAAGKYLGAEVEHMDVADCVYRTDPQGAPLYPSEESLWHNIHPQDPALRHVSGFRLPEAATHVYVPLGVGSHVDHLVVREIGLAVHNLLEHAAQDVPHQLIFYSEFPYHEQAGAIEQALGAMPPHIKLVAQAVHLTHADIIAKIEGVKAYRSQISTFWEDEVALEKRVRAALVQKSSTPAEQYFHVHKGKERDG